MKNTRKWALLMVSLAIALLNLSLYAAKEAPLVEKETTVLTDGVEPGKFTQDYVAALKYAKEKGLPVLMNFTGSDWCGWCKLMDKNVFSKPEWKEYAKNNLVLIYIDFPRKNPDLVPEKYRKRNNDLSQEYGVQGFPTYVLLDSKGLKLGQLGAGKDKTPKNFIADINKLLLMTDAGIRKLCKDLKPEDAAKVMANFASYKKLNQQKSKLTKKLNVLKKEETAKKKTLDESIEAGKVNSMSKEKKAEYETAKTALKKAQADAEAWMKKNGQTRPTPELRKRFNALNQAVSDAQAKVESF
jgi:protein disulfide-isomerase